MKESIIIELAQNVSILLAFSMLYDYFWSRNERLKNIYFKFSSGLILGIVGIVLILTPWHFVSGIIFDTRSVMLSIAGLFFGPIPTITAMIITASYRLFIGGNGAIMGTAVILSSGTIGLLWAHFRPNWKKNKYAELISLGILVHLVMLSCTLLLPSDLIWKTLTNIALPVILLYPLSSLLLGVLMLHQAENSVNRRTIKDNETRFRTIIEQATDSMFLSDMEGNIIDCNKQAYKRLGYTRDELLKLNVAALDDQFSTLQKVMKLFDNIDTNKKLIFESVHRGKSGNTFPVEISSSLIELNGSLNVIGFVRDISERKENEQKIIRMGHHYKALIEKAPDGIVLIDVDREYKFMSPSACKMFGYSIVDEITGSLDRFVHPDDLTFVISQLDNIQSNPSIVPTIQFRFKGTNSQWLWVESTFSNLLADPSVEAIVINFRDVTDRKLADEEIKKLNEELELKVAERTDELKKRSKELIDNEVALLNLVEDLNIKSEELQISAKQLEATNKELEAFSYSVSHDLRAPLRAINGFVSILLEDYHQVLDDEGKRICLIIHSNAVKMGQLIDDLLSFSRLIRSELHNSTIDMQSLVRTLIVEFQSSKELDPNVISLQELPQSTGDSNLIKQVWTNLISNAIKYSSKTPNPQITIGANTTENEIIYFIKDNGVGFSMNYIHKLFGVFQRLHGANEFEGTGVGLAIVQRIVTRHGGRVWAEGEIGKGATFYFTLTASASGNNKQQQT